MDANAFTYLFRLLKMIFCEISVCSFFRIFLIDLHEMLNVDAQLIMTFLSLSLVIDSLSPWVLNRPEIDVENLRANEWKFNLRWREVGANQFKESEIHNMFKGVSCLSKHRKKICRRRSFLMTWSVVGQWVAKSLQQWPSTKKICRKNLFFKWKIQFLNGSIGAGDWFKLVFVCF